MRRQDLTPKHGCYNSSWLLVQVVALLLLLLLPRLRPALPLWHQQGQWQRQRCWMPFEQQPTPQQRTIAAKFNSIHQPRKQQLLVTVFHNTLNNPLCAL